MNKLEFLEMYLDLYINHFVILEALKDPNSDYVVLDNRNAPKEMKKEQIKGAPTDIISIGAPLFIEETNYFLFFLDFFFFFLATSFLEGFFDADFFPLDWLSF